MNAAPPASVIRALGVKVPRLVSDSRRIRPGDVFAAYPGERSDGRAFIPDALARGAAAVLWEQRGFTWSPAWGCPQLAVAELKQRLGELAAEVHGHPARDLILVGVTGTNGKTSTTHWIAQALAHLGTPAALVGTLGHGFPGALEAGLNTTPDAAQLQEMLAQLRAAGASAVAMEVSSHGLEQGRVNALPFRVALFTNLTRDHLDFHGSMEAYAGAKARLFAWPGLQQAVINADDAFGARLIGERQARQQAVLSYGFGGGDLRGRNLRQSPAGISFELTGRWGEAHVASPMVGAFNAYNLLGVLGVLLALGHPLPQAVAALAACQPVPGRMQSLGGDGQALVVIDYAHTPDALENALLALRPVVAEGGRLICVFGCGGDRDAGKRPLMGALAARLADRVIVTSDNPRSEPPEAIIGQILAGIAQVDRGEVSTEADRGEAIHLALGEARAADVVLIAGKGHEPYQEIQGRREPFSDLERAQAELSARGRA
ncbi:MAG: UDP-N-acetylmuramoyl-L-alanyl-D-glutamate--2,6-diaminopimelate ligase [Betaproteobacteria bacterium]|nr:UDP-N-acetylmuramoyl-L-alanyl-D-glutamate--2,6-diaminopimelate ligase [Betaproteobacteria bacterium]